MFQQTFDSWCGVVSRRLAGYCGRELADLPDGVIPLLRWVYGRGHDAQSVAAVLSEIAWPGRVTLVSERGIA